MRIPDTMMIASEFIREKERTRADAVFVDETGGYGAGVIAAMRAFVASKLGDEVEVPV